MITVGHVMKTKELDRDAVWVRVDRPTPLGNPFVMMNGSDEERDKVIDAYAVWLRDKVADGDKTVLQALSHIAEICRGGRDVVLLCWCHPKKCHADVIKKMVEDNFIR